MTRSIFFGTPALAVPALRALARVTDVRAVVCQPDKPVGRSSALEPPPVKVAAQELGVAVHQPTKVRVPEFAAWVREQQADFALVLAYGRILVPDVLAAPRRGCLNLHASILPKYRGAAPIQWAVARGETETGITLMQMDAGLDTGPMLAVRRLPIGENETAGELAVRMGELAAAMVEDEVLAAGRGELAATPQDDAASTLAPILKKEDGVVDFDRPARLVHAHVRGMTPWPGASTKAGGKGFKLLETRVATDWKPDAPGTVRVWGKRVTIACAEGAIEVVRGQIEGRKPLSALELVGGRAIGDGLVLGA